MGEGTNLIAMRRENNQWIVDEDPACVLDQESEGGPVVILHAAIGLTPAETNITRLTITWEGAGVARELECAIKVLLKQFGLECWAQGFNFAAYERDMAFMPTETTSG